MEHESCETGVCDPVGAGAAQRRCGVAGAVGDEPPSGAAGHPPGRGRGIAGGGGAGVSGLLRAVGKVRAAAESGGMAGQGRPDRRDGRPPDADARGGLRRAGVGAVRGADVDSAPGRKRNALLVEYFVKMSGTVSFG